MSEEGSERPAEGEREGDEARASRASAGEGDVRAGESDGGESEARGGEGQARDGRAGGEIELPAFARHYPRHPELDRLLRAFVEGNYALVREEAPKLAKREAKGPVGLAARDLRSRIEPDPMALFMLGAAGALLLVLVLWFYGHRH